MTTLSPFGDLFILSDLEAAARDTLQKWMPTYLAELDRQHNAPVPHPGIATPASVVTHRLDAPWPDENLPRIVVQCPGTTSLERRGDGWYDAWYALTVICVVAAPSLDDTLKLSAFYAAAARAILLQKPTLEGVASASRWLEERYDRLEGGASMTTQRSLQVSAITMEVLVEHVVNQRAGIEGDLPDPAVPPPYVYPDTPTSQTVFVDADSVRDQDTP